jgi:hypothetical protein
LKGFLGSLRRGFSAWLIARLAPLIIFPPFSRTPSRNNLDERLRRGLRPAKNQTSSQSRLNRPSDEVRSPTEVNLQSDVICEEHPKVNEEEQRMTRKKKHPPVIPAFNATECTAMPTNLNTLMRNIATVDIRVQCDHYILLCNICE